MVWRLAEQWLCGRIAKLCGPDCSDYVSEESRLHIGYCWLVLNHPDLAHKALLEFVSSKRQVPAQLWGYFGDVCMDLGRATEANTGYLRGLFVEPKVIDLRTLRHDGINAIKHQLLLNHNEEEALALLPIKCWLAGLVYIPKRASWIRDLAEEIRSPRAVMASPRPATNSQLACY